MQLKTKPADGSLNRKQRRALKKRNPRVLNTATAELPPHGNITADLERARKFQDSEDFVAAKEIYERLLKSHPEYPSLYIAIAGFHRLQRDLYSTYIALKKAVELEPDNARYWHYLSVALKKRSEIKAAIIARKKSIELQPDKAEYYMALGSLLDRVRETDDALTAFEMAVKLEPENDMAHFSFGTKLQNLGQFGAAKQALWKAIEINPQNLAVFYRMLMDKGLDSEEVDEILAKIEAAFQADDLPDEARSSGLFAVARIYENKKDYDQSFHHYLQANQMDRKTYRFGREEYEEFIDNLIEAFQPDVFEHLKEVGTASSVPVFVVGMPRSGTTLVEQILGSHSQVYGAGEMNYFLKLNAELLDASKTSDTKYPNDIKQMNCDILAQMGKDHLTDLRENYSSTALRIIDKMPGNVINLGLIAILFPQASIIHTIRDPMDTCWSCYVQNFNNKRFLSWTHSLEDAGFYYQQYRRLMDHWQKVLPLKILDVHYEGLLDSQESISRQMIEHIGLDWEDACLKFYEQDHSVHTASAWQVRQPIYKTSVEKWRRFEKHLAPLKQALGDYYAD